MAGWRGEVNDIAISHCPAGHPCVGSGLARALAVCDTGYMTDNPISPDRTPKTDQKPVRAGRKGPKSKSPGVWQGKGQPRRTPSAPRLELGALAPDAVRIYGIHAAERALQNPARVIRRLLATQTVAERLDLDAITHTRFESTDAGQTGLAAPLPNVEIVTSGQLDGALGAGTVHQGLLIETKTLAQTEITPLLDRLHDRLHATELAGATPAERWPPLVIVLDHVTDPHNVGAILRSAAAFRADGLVMTQRYSPALGGALAKAATGALEDVPVTLVVNLADALDELRSAGLSLVGLEADGDGPLEGMPAFGATALVVGAEDRGLRAKTRALCDGVHAIGTAGGWTSLNVSNAAAVAMHWVRHHPA